MKIALDWIAEYLSPVPEASVAADLLMNAGLPVESIVEAAGGDGKMTPVLDVEVTSNRTDCFSHVGLARELSALTGGRFALPKIALQESSAPAELQITVEDDEACAYYSARIIRNVKVGPSPEWLVRRLESIGLRAVNNVVDITNYLLMEMGQPLHAFDLSAVTSGQLVIRLAGKGEKLLAIDNREYALDGSMLVIADAISPLAIAGVMGGKASEVTEKTTDILLESARFDPLSIRTTSRALGLKSDSSYRFERGLDPTLADMASRRAAQMIVELCGSKESGGGDGTSVSPAVKVGQGKAHSLTVSMRFSRFTQITGMTVAPDRALGILSGLGFAPYIDDEPGEMDDRVRTRVPSHRLDVTREIDLIEEVARVLGYSHIPTLERVSHPVSPEPAGEKAARTILRTLVEAGFSEAATVAFVGENEAKLFLREAGHSLIHPQHAGWRADVLRPSLFPSLLAARRTNQNAGTLDARLFEKAETFEQPANATAAPLRTRSLAAVAGDLSALAALLRLLPDRLSGAQGVTLTAVPREFGYFQKGASAEVVLHSPASGASGLPIGRMGIFTREIQQKYDLRLPAAGLELDYDMLLPLFTETRRATAIPRFPGIKRDLSIVVDESVRWAQVKEALAGAKLQSVESIHFVTTFRSKEVGAGKKSLTLALEFRDPGRTLKSEEVDGQVQAAIGVLAKEFGATLRA